MREAPSGADDPTACRSRHGELLSAAVGITDWDRAPRARSGTRRRDSQCAPVAVGAGSQGRAHSGKLSCGNRIHANPSVHPAIKGKRCFAFVIRRSVDANHMNKLTQPARVLAALADPTRRRLWTILGPPNRRWSVKRLAQELNFSSSTISYQLKKLVSARLCDVFYEGRYTFISRNALAWRTLAPALGLADETPPLLDIRAVVAPACVPSKPRS